MQRLNNPTRPWLGGAKPPLIIPGKIDSLQIPVGVSLVSGVVTPSGGTYEPTRTSASAPSGWSTQEHVVGSYSAPNGVISVAAWAGGFWGAMRAEGGTVGRSYTGFTPTPSDGIIPFGKVWGISIGPPRKVQTYGFTPTNITRAPISWTVEGSNNSAGPWTVLDIRSNETWPGSAIERVFTFANEDLYTHYRFTFTKISPTAQYLDFYNIRLQYESAWSCWFNPALLTGRTPIPKGAIWLSLTAGIIDRSKTSIFISRLPTGDLDDVAVTDLRLVGNGPDGAAIYYGTVDFAGTAAGIGTLRSKISSTQQELRINGCTVQPLAA